MEEKCMESSIILEVKVSTDSENCHHIGDGRYEFCLEQLDWRPEECMRIGLRNILLPIKKKSLTFKYFVGMSHEVFKAEKMQEKTICFSTWEEFGDMVEATFNAAWHSEMSVCLNFQSPHSKHVCSFDNLCYNRKMSICFRNGRFFLKIAAGLKLVVSCNLVRELGFKVMLEQVCPVNSESKDVDEYIEIKKLVCYSDEKIEVDSVESKSFVMAIFDCIEGTIILNDGARWPILFHGLIKNNKIGVWGQILALKKMKNRNMRKFVFGIYDYNMRPFQPQMDFRLNPVCFNLVFFKS